MDPLVSLLNKALANTFVMYFKAHSHHWNVEGIHFSQYHEFFGDLYTELHAASDALAEQIRMLQAKAPLSLGALYASNSVDEGTAVADVSEMINNLLDANGIVKQSLYDCLAEAQKQNKQGLVNFLADRIMKHDKHDWMLRVSLKGT
jgi:starvation-inducible DNA-binding protein